MTVADFQTKHFLRSIENRLELVNTSLPFARIKRYRNGAANESSVDPVDLGDASDSVMALFSRYGFDHVPTNWSELRGNHRYIEELQSILDSLRVGFKNNLAAGLSFVQDFRPALVPVVRAWIAGGEEALKQYHRDHDTYRTNASTYDESTELPVKDYSAADNEWPEHLR